MLSKIIIDYLIQKLSLDEIREFNKTVLIPQNAINLSQHFKAAEEILIQQQQTDEKQKKQ